MINILHYPVYNEYLFTVIVKYYLTYVCLIVQSMLRYVYCLVRGVHNKRIFFAAFNFFLEAEEENG